MNASAPVTKGTIVPSLRYRDVSAAIDWLCRAFGLERHHVVAAEDGSVSYAQLAFGDGLVMLGPVEDATDGALMAQPDVASGLETHVCYLFVDDARAHCARAKSAGASIVLDIDDAASDGRGYSCRDPEGHVWNFGTYDPRQCRSVPARRSTRMQTGVRRLALMVGTVANAVTSVAFLGWLCAATENMAAYASVPGEAEARVERAADDALARAMRETREQLARERIAREQAERSAKDVRDQLAREKSAKEQIERAATEVRDQLAREKTARATTEPAADMRAALQRAEKAAAEADERLRKLEQGEKTAREEAARERAAREAAERAAAGVKDQLGKERVAREAAETDAKRAREQIAKSSAPKKAPYRPKSESSGAFSVWQ